MESRSRAYQTEDDFWHMREFLRHVFLLNNRLVHSWHVARLDYARWHTCLNCAKVPLQEVVTLWETNAQLTAILMPDGGRGEAHLLVHPTLRTRELEEEMLTVAEQRLVSVKPDGSAKLCVWAPEADALRQQIQVQRGYAQEGWPEIQWRHRLDAPIPDVPVAAGYMIRALGDGLELLERCYASGLGFHEGTFGLPWRTGKIPPGTAISKPPHHTAATSIWWPLRPMERSPRFAPSGSMM